MDKYNLTLDENNYVLLIAKTKNGNVELDLSKYDLSHISCYRFVNGALVLDENKLNELKAKEKQYEIKEEITNLKQELSSYDYIGIKISMGVATKEEYAEKISYTETIREKIRELENELK